MPERTVNKDRKYPAGSGKRRYDPPAGIVVYPPAILLFCLSALSPSFTLHYPSDILLIPNHVYCIHKFMKLLTFFIYLLHFRHKYRMIFLYQLDRGINLILVNAGLSGNTGNQYNFQNLQAENNRAESDFVPDCGQENGRQETAMYT